MRLPQERALEGAMQSPDMYQTLGVLRHQELLLEAEEWRRVSYARSAPPSRLALVLVRLGERIADYGRKLEVAHGGVAMGREAQGRVLHG